MRANHSRLKAPYINNNYHRVSFTPPFSLVNQMTLKPLNNAYFYMNKLKKNKSIMGYEHFFYPLDSLLEWNRLYGPKGFYQYQSVVPHKYRKDATQAMIKEISKSHEGSFLAVLKTFGNKVSRGMLSFPMPGVTLALDFPNCGESTLKLFNRLDHIIREAEGRIYCAKDARMSKDLFELGYPRLNEFIKYRDPGISSALSRRLMGN
jgi:hypothetical protein